ncbi:hypothetical protein LJR143_003289 [Pseudoxanthomonas sp. LjRoot143]|uniref:hypothetical protein n=1 Tax=Pseudoxanthomonas sp. LjRoot143 TaxID=3342266 RepID=UPI003ECEAB7B
MKSLLALLLPMASFIQDAAAASPQDVVKEFYTREIHGPYSSDGRMLGNVRHLLSDELDALLTATDRYQAACTRLVPPGVKPWIIDGDPWYYYSSDGARSIDGTTLVSHGKTTAHVTAQLTYDSSMRWADTVTLVKAGDTWRIANIRFEQGGSLIKSLHTYIKHRCANG